MNLFVVDVAGVTVMRELELIRLWDADWNLIAVKPAAQLVEDFVASHVKPGSYGHVTRDCGGKRWAFRAEVSVKFRQEYEALKSMQAWALPRVW
jgi:hypothetical protein